MSVTAGRGPDSVGLVAALALAAVLFAPRPAVAAGDLFHYLGWGWNGYASGTWFDMWLSIRSEQATWNTQSNGGYESVYVEVDASFPARNTDRPVEAYGEAWAWGEFGQYVQIGSAYDYVVIPHPGPGSVNLSFSAFIPPDFLFHPVWGHSVLFGGDDRGFTYYGGTARMTQVFDVFNPAINDSEVLSGPFSTVGLTEEYDGPTSRDPSNPSRLRPEAKNDWSWGGDMKLRWDSASVDEMACDYPERRYDQYGLDSSTLIVHCRAAATIPLFAWAPAIDWDYTVRLTFYDRGFDYEVTGCHDQFPAHELYLNGHAALLDQPQGEWSLYWCSSISSTYGAVR